MNFFDICFTLKICYKIVSKCKLQAKIKRLMFAFLASKQGHLFHQWIRDVIIILEVEQGDTHCISKPCYSQYDILDMNQLT